MRTTAFLLVAGLLLGMSSCEKDDKLDDDGNNNNNPPSNSTLANNTIYAGSDSASLNLFTAYRAIDVNTNQEYIDIFIYKDSPLNRENYLQIGLKEIPSVDKVLNWQSGASAPGALTPDEFVIFPKVNDKTWYGVYTTTGFETTGEMTAKIDSGKLILTYEDIELADNFISINVTERMKNSGKITFNLSDLQNLGTSPGTPASLVD